MLRHLSLLLLLCGASLIASRPGSAIEIDTVSVGNLGNADRGLSKIGGVDYGYRIGTTEVTAGQYTEFLKAASYDGYGLYNPGMFSASSGSILQTNIFAPYFYLSYRPDMPVNFVSWGDAARFCNWLHNGQPANFSPGAVGTTEDGAYTLNGATTDAALSAVTRNAGAKWFIPTEDEWYKAAYHKNDGVTGNYWDFPTSTNAVPYSDQPPGSDAPMKSNAANFYKDDLSVNGYNDGYAVTGSKTYSPTENQLTDAGAYANSTSPYGTLDQGGNVQEWNEDLHSGVNRNTRGGSFASDLFGLLFTIASGAPPTYESVFNGFRVATILPLPGDATWDDLVDGADYTVWADHYLQTVTNWTNGDFNGDGFVDGGDYTSWADNYTPEGASATATPEPSTFVLAGLGILGLFAGRRVWLPGRRRRLARMRNA